MFPALVVYYLMPSIGPVYLAILSGLLVYSSRFGCAQERWSFCLALATAVLYEGYILWWYFTDQVFDFL